MSLGELASDVAEWLRAHDVRECVLAGHSLGGKVAMALCLGPDAGLAGGLIVLDIAPAEYEAGDGTRWGEIGDLFEALSALPIEGCSSKKEADALLAASVPDPSLRSFVLTNAVKTPAGSLAWRCNLPAIAASLPTLAAFSLPAPPAPYAGDAFWINGGSSRYVRARELPRIGELFPRHKIATVRGAGHWVHAEREGDVLKLVRSFLER
ncbi:hypothetical protein TeGR_g7460 [Tetraparma gracilis]|uniref:AB hydrolase-1 domain-containing protein n=1 Tax=Tetraparma gracilis TaxID=2962635 RepID=A0ABQ6MEV5_9STRA|nr:hypothetical protein TeGR_g7460 [Tetraparma gracilis]